MEEKQSILESLIDSAEDYGKSSIELMKLKAIRKLTEVVSSIAANTIVVCMILLFVFILSIGLSFYIGDALGKTYLGFFVVAGIYLLLTVILMIGSKPILKIPIGNAIVKQIID